MIEALEEKPSILKRRAITERVLDGIDRLVRIFDEDLGDFDGE